MNKLFLIIFIVFGQYAYCQNGNYFAPDDRINNLGEDNTFVGENSGFSNNIGRKNSFFGSFSGKSTTIGISNSFFGKSAGYANTSGNRNTYIGVNSGYGQENQSTGSDNTAMGYESGYSLTSGRENTFIGKDAGRSVDIGLNNTFIGVNSGRSVNTGTLNVLIGHNSGSNITVGLRNTIIGQNAGSAGVAVINNVYIGQESGRANTNSQNTFVGTKSGYNNINGANNVFIGYEAGYNELESNKFYVSNSRTTTLLYGNFPTQDQAASLGVGTNNLQESLNLEGAILLGSSRAENSGTIRYNNGDFEGRKGESWASLTFGEVEVNALLAGRDQQIIALQNENTQQQEQINSLIARLEALEGVPNAIGDELGAELLYQNQPNPFSQSTRIRYNVPLRVNAATLYVFDMSGKQLKKFDIAQRGEGSVQIEAGELEAGMYIYSLIMDGKLAASKRMILVD